MAEWPQVEEKAPKVEWEGLVYRTAFEWKSLKETPDDVFRAMLVANNWSDVQRLSEAEYTKGVATVPTPQPR
jgi:hypothetical protein